MMRQWGNAGHPDSVILYRKEHLQISTMDVRALHILEELSVEAIAEFVRSYPEALKW